LPYAELMLIGVVRATTVPLLCTAVADLCNLAGWTDFDQGRPGIALAAFGRALELATVAENDELVANICYRAGRLHLHHDAVGEAMKQFEHGQVAARRTDSMLARAILSANQAWAAAKLGDAAAALEFLAAAEAEFEAAAGADPPPWAAFFGATDLAAMTGTVHAELALGVDAGHGGAAIAALTGAVGGYGPAMARSKSLTQIWLATSHVVTGDLDVAARVGAEAVDLASGLRSVRTRQRTAPLAAAARRAPDSPYAREIVDRIDDLHRSAGG
jgi:tetratricopeptide (TPR) repeat protein